MDTYWLSPEWVGALLRRKDTKKWKGWPGKWGICFIDWSGKRGLVAFHGSSDTPTMYGTFLQLVQSLAKPTVIVAECTFCSFSAKERTRVMEEIRKLGHLLLVVPSRATPRKRVQFSSALGIEAKRPDGESVKTDVESARVIREEARKTDALSVPKPTPKLDSRTPAQKARIKANEIVRLTRCQGTMVMRPKAKDLVLSTEKDRWASEIEKMLPPFEILPDEKKRSLGMTPEPEKNVKEGEERRNTKYSLTLIASAAAAVKCSSNRAEFDTLTGLFDNAYPSQLRSDFNLGGWAGNGKKVARGSKVRYDKLTFAEYRKSIRWLGSQINTMELAGKLPQPNLNVHTEF